MCRHHITLSSCLRIWLSSVCIVSEDVQPWAPGIWAESDGRTWRFLFLTPEIGTSGTTAEPKNTNGAAHQWVTRMPTLPTQNHLKTYKANPALSSSNRQLLPVRKKKLHVFREQDTYHIFIFLFLILLALSSEMSISNVSENSTAWPILVKTIKWHKKT